MVDDTTALEHEADDTRDRIAAAIDSLQERLSPTAIVHRTVEQISASSSEAVATVKQNFGAHPAMFAAGGVAIGLAVLLHGKSSAKQPSVEDHSRDPSEVSSGPSQRSARLATLSGRGEPLVGAVMSAVAGAVLAQVLPVSAAEAKLLSSVENRPKAAAPSLQHRL